MNRNRRSSQFPRVALALTRLSGVVFLLLALLLCPLRSHALTNDRTGQTVVTDGKEDEELSDAELADDPARLARAKMSSSRHALVRGWVTTGIGTGTAAFSSAMFWGMATPKKEPETFGEALGQGIGDVVALTFGTVSHIGTLTLFSIGGLSGFRGSLDCRRGIEALGGTPSGKLQLGVAWTFFSVGMGSGLVAMGMLMSGPETRRDFANLAAVQTASVISMLLSAILFQSDLITERIRLQELIEQRGLRASQTRTRSGVDATLTVTTGNGSVGLALAGTW